MNDSHNPHHLVMGQLEDYLTGRILPDTHDERYRQKLAKLLVIENGFHKRDIVANTKLKVVAGNKKAELSIDFIVKYRNKICILIKYAPGSLVSRRLSTLALSRIVCSYQIPIVVFANGEDAEIIDGESGKVLATGLEGIPTKTKLNEIIKNYSFAPVDSVLFDKASRIAYACEVDGACPCDSDICVIED